MEGKDTQETVGVLALQGDFAKHITMLGQLDVKTAEVRTPAELAAVDRLIIPGGESSTVSLLIQKLNLDSAIVEAARKGMPVWGTCMGMITMAQDVQDRAHQFTLNLLDITVSRNAFGAQVHSFEDKVTVEGLAQPVLGVFIRAPVVTRVGTEVQVLGVYREHVVAVRQGLCLGTSFHPELTDDTRMHEFFLKFGS